MSGTSAQDKILFTCMRISDFATAAFVTGDCRYINRTDVQFTTSSDVFQIKLDSI